MTEQKFELARRTFDTPEFRGITCIEVEARSVINKVSGGMPFDWTINPYRGCTHACVYCFARPTHTYLDMDAGRDFETKIVVKVNAPEVPARELASRRWKGEHIAMGTPTVTVGLPTWAEEISILPVQSLGLGRINQSGIGRPRQLVRSVHL